MHRYANYTNAQFIATVTEGTFKHSRSQSFDPFGQRRGSPPLTKRIEALGTRMTFKVHSIIATKMRGFH